MIFPEGYDEGPCRVCGKHAFGMAYDVAGICDECAKEWDWNVEWEHSGHQRMGHSASTARNVFARVAGGSGKMSG